MKKCLIRVDSNGTIGTGHFMRCLAIARELKKKCQVIFVLADATEKKRLEKEGFSYICLESQWDDMEGELEKINAVIQKEAAHILLVDSYQVTSHYLSCVRERIKTVYIDDLHQCIYPCDLLVNYAVYAEDHNYKKIYAGSGTRLLLGCSYTPLREEFSEIPDKKIGHQIKKVLVLTGGTDTYHFALNFAEKIVSQAKWRGTAFQIICGKYNKDIGRLQELKSEYSHLYVYSNISQLSGYMQQADIAVSAGGTTLYELMACGTPTIAYSLADNQTENLKAFAQKGYLLSAGDIRGDFPKERLLEQLEYLKCFQKRNELSIRMKQLVDGKGCCRLVAEILK